MATGGLGKMHELSTLEREIQRLAMAKNVIKAVVVATALNLLTISAAYPQDWNYFGDCYSDDVILAKNGKWFLPCMSRGGCKREWDYGGIYRVLSDGVIEIYWKDDNGNLQSSTYTHRRLSKVKCTR